LDHADDNDPDDAINLNFGAKIVDYDGDIAEGTFTVIVKDDAPTIEADSESLDETDGFPTSVDGQVYYDFGEDGPGEICVDGNFNATGSVLNNNLTSNGFPVVVTPNPAGDTYTGVANGVTIFTLVLDTNTGKYDFTLEGPLDHADPNDDNDVITLEFGVKAEDYEGDQTSTTIKIDVLDDVPRSSSPRRSPDPGFVRRRHRRSGPRCLQVLQSRHPNPSRQRGKVRGPEPWRGSPQQHAEFPVSRIWLLRGVQ